MRIELSNVSFLYEKDHALRDIDAQLPSGKLTVLCGKTGSGKSTLLHLLSGLEKPSSGTIVYSEANPRQRIAIVFQAPETQLFAGSVRQDIEYGLELKGIPRQERLDRTSQALAKVGFDPAAILDRSPFLLSGGEKRRVVIAGALALEPDMLILDEPTAGLDPSSTKDLLDVLVQLRSQGLTIVISTHDLETFFPLADQVMVMLQGRTHYNGPARELVSSPHILESAGLEVPAATRIAYRLRSQGVPVDVPVSMDELLSALSAHKLSIRRKSLDEHPDTAPNAESGQASSGSGGDAPSPWEALETSGSLLKRLDPRAKWLGMVILSLAILHTSSLWGTLASLLVTAVILKAADISWRKTWKFLSPFFLLFIFLWLFAAVSIGSGDVSIGPFGLSYSGAIKGGIGVFGFLFIIALGLAFTETTSGVPLREGFEWGIRPLRRIQLPTRDLSMAVSITIQFVPWILEKVGQLRKALASRGQDTIGMRKWTPRQISFLFVPLLIIVIKMGDELVSAIESRGYDRQAERTSWYKLRWSVKDTWVSGLVATASSLLWWFG
ncbi:ATP-binding cassette domain-containing protein [Paenibacillus filicis]|uniref:ATP-binding cassette domain-containing protein n=1 Tax=Paenibacillus filicis TaxID=669464 RepID=A0ABU9DCY9_9BACL